MAKMMHFFDRQSTTTILTEPSSACKERRPMSRLPGQRRSGRRKPFWKPSKISACPYMEGATVKTLPLWCRGRQMRSGMQWIATTRRKKRMMRPTVPIGVHGQKVRRPDDEISPFTLPQPTPGTLPAWLREAGGGCHGTGRGCRGCCTANPVRPGASRRRDGTRR